MEQGNFTNLSWEDGHEHASSVASPRGEAEGGAAEQNDRVGGTSVQAGRDADDLDLAGVGSATLECTVTHPMKENDGTKDAYVSYLVTTHVFFHCYALVEGQSNRCRLRSHHSPSLPPLFADASRTLSSSIRR